MVRRSDPILVGGSAMFLIGMVFVTIGALHANELATKSCFMTREDWYYLLSHNIPSWAVLSSIVGSGLILYKLFWENGGYSEGQECDANER